MAFFTLGIIANYVEKRTKMGLFQNLGSIGAHFVTKGRFFGLCIVATLKKSSVFALYST